MFNYRKYTPAEIQRMRPAYEVQCRQGCGSRVLITGTVNGKCVVLEPQEDGPFVLDTDDVAHWVGEGGEFDFHRCPMWEEREAY